MIPHHDPRKAGRYISRVKLDSRDFDDTTRLIPPVGDVAKKTKPPKDARRRIHWKVAEILTPSTMSTYTMDNSSIADTLRTCATEATHHTMTTSTPAALLQKKLGDGTAAPRKSKAPHVKGQSHLNDNGMEMIAAPSHDRNPKNLDLTFAVPFREETIHVSSNVQHSQFVENNRGTLEVMPVAVAPPSKPSKSVPRAKKIIPHITCPTPTQGGETHRTAGLDINANSVSPVDSPDTCSFSLSTSLDCGTFESSSSSTTLTPISPTRLTFEDVLDEGQELPDMSYLDISPTRGRDSPSSEDYLLCDEELALVLFPRGAGLPTLSPLTPSPELISPPVRPTHCKERRPHPFLLEKILSESYGRPDDVAHDDDVGYNSSLEDTDFSFLRHDLGYTPISPSQERSPLATHRRQRSFSEELPMRSEMGSEHRRRTKSLGAGATSNIQEPEQSAKKANEDGPDQPTSGQPSIGFGQLSNAVEPHSSAEVRPESTKSSKAVVPALAACKAKKFPQKTARFDINDAPTKEFASAARSPMDPRSHSEGHLSGLRPTLRTSTLMSKSEGAIRTTTKSVPVDVDDVQFVDVDKNLQTIEDMAVEHMANEEYEEALVVFKEILRGQLERHGYEHERVGTALHNIGIVQLRRRSYAKAVQVSEKAVHIRRLALGFDHPDVAVSLVQLGFAQFESQKYSRALRNFREALHIRRAGGGNDRIKVAKLLNNIACTLKQLGDGRGALAAFEEALAIQRAELDSLSNQGNNPDTIEVFRELLLSTASSLSNICTVKISLNELDEAYAALEEALMVQNAVLGDEHPEARETQKGFTYIDELRAKRGMPED